MIGTTFLTNVFILQGVTEQTVRVDVTTSLQIFVLVNIVMVVVALLQYLAVLYMVSERPKKKLPLYRRPVIRNIKPPPVLDHDCKNGKVHRLDSIFRITAPVVYLLFCLVYFGYYLH